MIVGVHRSAEKTLRLQEYSPGFNPERFAAHETFFTRDVHQRVRPSFEVALPVGRLANATGWESALRDAGADVVMTERPGSPGDVLAHARN